MTDHATPFIGPDPWSRDGDGATAIEDDAVQMTVESTPLGRVLIAATGAGVVRVSVLGDRPAHRSMRTLASRLALPVAVEDYRLGPVVAQLQAYLTGQRVDFDLPLDLRLATASTRRILGAVHDIPYGTTVTTSQVAAAAGRLGRHSTRVALSMNPLSIVVPDHRVLRRDSTAEYPGGAQAQRFLVELERAVAASREQGETAA